MQIKRKRPKIARDFKYVAKICPVQIGLGHVIRRMRSDCKLVVSSILYGTRPQYDL